MVEKCDMKHPHLEAVLFDLDGVLVDACDWHYESLNIALVEAGRSPISRDDHLARFNGLPTRTKLKMLGLEGDEAAAVERGKQRHTLRVIAERACPMPEKIELHRHLKSEGLSIACVTNSIRETAEEMLRRTGQLGLMDMLVTNEDVERNKPHPDPYLKAMEGFGVEAGRCVCVEDSPNGIRSATASGALLWRVDGVRDVSIAGWKGWNDGRQ
jgi:HAD superfamily hydrolase (TIGR01509 family)